jgi:uncharacterized membrane protein
MFSAEHIHPMVVHFPIALIISGYLAEVTHLFIKKEPVLKEFYFWLLAAGFLSSFAAYFSGAFLTSTVPPEATAVYSRHELFAELTVFTTLVNTALMLYLKLEKKDETRLKWLAFALNTITVILLFITGHNGGVLVYDYLLK